MSFILSSKQAQTWSFDLIIAVTLFIVVIAVFYALLSNNNQETGAQEQQDIAKTVSSQLVCDSSVANPYCVVQNGKLNSSKLKVLSDASYSSLKRDFGVAGDFCLYMVVVDNNGTERIVPFENSTGAKFAGLGDGAFELTDTTVCGQKLS